MHHVRLQISQNWYRNLSVVRETTNRILGEQSSSVPKEGHGCSFQCEVLIFFLGQASECASHIQYTHSKLWINISGPTFYHMPWKKCGENKVRGDTVETGLIAMTVLLTTLLCMCRNFWLIMTWWQTWTLHNTHILHSVKFPFAWNSSWSFRQRETAQHRIIQK